MRGFIFYQMGKLRKQLVPSLLVFQMLVLLLVPVTGQTMTCSGVTKYLGIEYVAECTGDSSYRYVETDIECINGQVVKGPVQRLVQGGQKFIPDAAQAFFVSSAQFASGTIFGNSEKTHFVIVTNTFAKNNGVLEGIALKPLAYAPTLHVDRLGGIAVIPKNVVDLDVDGDQFTVCDDCNDNNPAVNPAATEVCSDGQDNDCSGAGDCLDTACSTETVCLQPVVSISTAEFPPDSCLNVRAN